MAFRRRSPHREVTEHELRERAERLASGLGYDYAAAVTAWTQGGLPSTTAGAHLALLIGLLEEIPEGASA